MKKERENRAEGKKGVSLMVSYVLLVSIVVTLSVIVAAWIYFQVKNPPVGGESCEGVSVSAEAFCCYASSGGGGNPNPCGCIVGEQRCSSDGNSIETCNGNFPQCWDSVPCAAGSCSMIGGEPMCAIGTSGITESTQEENGPSLILQGANRRINFTIINTGRFTVQNVLVRVETLPVVDEVFRYTLPRHNDSITPNNYTNYSATYNSIGDGKIRWIQLIPVTGTLCSSQSVDFKLPGECDDDTLPSICTFSQ